LLTKRTTFSGESAATNPRTRLLGETIGAGDFIQAGDFRSTAIEMNCVGLIVRGTRIQVLTYDPLPIDVAALAKNAEWEHNEERNERALHAD
jgi:hypothetical protein